MDERETKVREIAEEIFSVTNTELMMKLRFLDRAIYMMKPYMYTGESFGPLVSDDFLKVYPIATEGVRVVYAPELLFSKYRKDSQYLKHAYLHLVLHCIFRHMLVTPLIDRLLWDVSCDIAVADIMEQLMPDSMTKAQTECLDKIRGKIDPPTAEKLYVYLSEKKPGAAELEKYIRLFAEDDHELWYIVSAVLEAGDGSNSGGGDPADSEAFGNVQARTELAERWEDIARHIQTDMETFSSQIGRHPGNFLAKLGELNREKYDYSAFLRRFATTCEVMRPDPDEFDYIAYTYGMETYGDMPLIEPLEYRDDKRIRELAIAIDTSGSTFGLSGKALVQRFVQKTYNILKQAETFSERFVLHIIQCDAAVQQDTVIRTQEEFDGFIKKMEIRGGGGTDFRPVFEYVNKLVAEKKFVNLRGLIYFTDGYGEYPGQAPLYQTAFAFVENEQTAQARVPSWAIRLVLDKDELCK